MNTGKTIVYNGIVYSKYTVTTDGRIFNAKTGRELKHTIVSNRYEPGVSLYDNGKKVNVKVARIVLETYKGKPAPLTDKHSALSWSVNHIDENFRNNNIDNLEWLTVADNARAYWTNKRKK